MAEVRLEGVGKIYPGGVRAVKDVNLTIPDAQFVVLVGPSGCGKSTTLRMVAGLEEISEGTISIGERVVNEVAPKDRDIAMVFQNYALYPHMTVYKNMAFGLKLRGFRKAEINERVKEAARILGIEQLLDRKPKALSGGQRQRVAVGRAIVRQPAAFLFDEPLSNLDAKLRVETRAELKRLHHTLKTTTIYVTHDQEEAMTLGERVVVMDQGEIQQCAPPMVVYGSPANRFVAGFLGTPPMNFLDGKLLRDAGIWFVGEGARLKLTDGMADRVSDHVDQPIVMGIRPELVRFHQEGAFGSDEGQSLDVKVSVVEPLGSSMDAYVDTTTGKHLVARVPAEQLQYDTAATLYVNMSQVHLFEPGAHGRNISLAESVVVNS